MAEHGGYRQPTNPAPVSGPGKLSQRTDGGPAQVNKQAQQKITGMGYGENKDLNEIQAQGTLAAAPGIPSAPISTPSVQVAPPTPLTAPTERPHEPVTAGMPFGPGPGPESLPVTNVKLSGDDRQRATVVLGMLQDTARTQNVSQGTINLIRQLRSEL